MTEISQLLTQLINDMAELRKDVNAIQRTLVRIEATTLQPVCRTRRHSASRTTQTWNNPQMVHQSNRFTPYGSNHPGGSTNISPPTNRTITVNNGRTSNQLSQYHCNVSGPSNMQITCSTRKASPVVGMSKRNRRNGPPIIRPAGPAETRLTRMRQVLQKAANTPVKQICKLHKNFGEKVDNRQCPVWCSFHSKPTTVQQTPNMSVNPPKNLMTVQQDNEQQQLPPPLQPVILASSDFEDVTSPLNPLSLEMEAELLDVSD